MATMTQSRVAKRPVTVPSGVKVDVNNGQVIVTGPKGKLQETVSPLVDVAVDSDQVRITRREETKQAKAMSGLYRSLIQNMVTGVSDGFVRVLEINGVGYRAEVKGSKLVLQLGYSNPVEFDIPKGIEAAVDKNTKVTVSGIDRQLVGETAARIRALRRPEPYKGKGIKYAEERIRRKVGKAGVK